MAAALLRPVFGQVQHLRHPGPMSGMIKFALFCKINNQACYRRAVRLLVAGQAHCLHGLDKGERHARD